MSICKKCGYERNELKPCEHCGRPAVFANVVMAQKPEETCVTDREFNRVIKNAEPKIANILKDFELSVRTESKAVLVRPLAEVLNLFDRLTNLHVGFHKRLSMGAVQFDNGNFDRHRPAVDGKLFPDYAGEISFAALSLNETGAAGTYGLCHLTLRTPMIEHRASVFEANSFEILVKKVVMLNEDVPKGLRSTWKRRGKLATSKLAPAFTELTTKADYPAILGDGDKDFIEVHVFGKISHRTIEKVVVVNSSLDDIGKDTANALEKTIARWTNTIPSWGTPFVRI